MANPRKHPGLRRALLTGVATALLVAACSNAGSTKTASTTSTATANGGSVSGVPGVTDTEIKFSALGTNSNNPLGTCELECFDDGVKAYFAFRNSQGGVDGRKLVLTKEVDDQVGNDQAKALEIVSANDTFATFSAALVASGWADLAKAGIPTYVWMINPAQMTGHPEIFGDREVVCITCTTRWSAYAVQLAHAKKFAAVGYGVSENSKQCAESGAASIEKYSKDIGGAKVVYKNDDLAFGLPNGIGPEVTAMKNAGVDFILGCLDLNGMKTLAQELRRQGIRDKVTMLHNNTYDQKFVKDAGDLFDGDIMQVLFRPFEANSGQSLKDFQTWMAKENKPITELAMHGWINADLAYQGLKSAGANFDRAKVIAATNRFTNFTADGLTQPVDWTRQHVAATESDPATHGPKYDCTTFVRVDKSGTFKLLGDPAKPWECWPGTTRDWSTPTAMNFK